MFNYTAANGTKMAKRRLGQDKKRTQRENIAYEDKMWLDSTETVFWI